MGFELATLEVIGTDCIGNYKSNYHMITTTMAPNDIGVCVVFCRSLLVLFLLALVLSVLYFTASDYNFGIFKLFFENIKLNSTVQLFSILIPHCRKSMKNFIT